MGEDKRKTRYLENRITTIELRKNKYKVLDEDIEWLLQVANQFLEDRKRMGNRDFYTYDRKLRDELYRVNFELGNLKIINKICEEQVRGVQKIE